MEYFCYLLCDRYINYTKNMIKIFVSNLMLKLKRLTIFEE